jgi:hypothetical protein
MMICLALALARSLGLALALVTAAAPHGATATADKLVIVSVSDVKGKTGPCGCHVPKGGIARLASFADSTRAEYRNVLLVDNGGFFPEDAARREASGFLMDMMKRVGTGAVGCSERELHFGLGYLRAQLARTHAPMVCANLHERKSGRPVLPPYLLRQVGTVRVGIFGLMSDVVDLGPARDSLRVEEPASAAKRTIAELRRRGATVVVLLAQLGKVEAEDLVTAVDGVDAVMVGHNVPLLMKGRMIKGTIACYGGEQGQYAGRTIVSLDARQRMIAGENETVMLGPEIPDRRDVAALVRAFEDSLDAKLGRIRKEEAASQALGGSSGAVEHYLGRQTCERCHPAEAAQWRGTAHARAYETLRATTPRQLQRMNALLGTAVSAPSTDPACLRCHVLGREQAGGYSDTTEIGMRAGVQCESCHGMGTQHEAFGTAARKVSEQKCRDCHTAVTSPTFDFARAERYVVHGTARTPAQPPVSPPAGSPAKAR